MRRSYEHTDSESLRMLFTDLVRPHLEFGNTAWSPRFEKDKKLPKSVSRRITKLIQVFATSAKRRKGNMGLYVHRNHQSLLGTEKLGGRECSHLAPNRYTVATRMILH